jgi:hypothetical protein
VSTVHFSVPDEFLEELAKDRNRVHRGIVRVAYRVTPSRASPAISSLSVVATAMVDGQVYRLEVSCGDLWHIGEVDRAVQEKAEKIRKRIEEECRQLGLEIRGGVLSEK